MEIRFKGLIAFVKFDTANKPKRYVAVLMNHGRHFPVLSAKKADVDTGESSLTPTASNNLYCFALAGRVATSLGTGLPATDTATAEIPSTALGFPLGVTTNDTIKKAAPNPSYFSVVLDLPPGGVFAVHNYFEYQGTFDNGTTFMCIPISLSYNVAATEPVTFYVGADTIVVDQNALVSITNLDPNGSGGHYHAFEHLFNESTTTNPPIDKNKVNKCGKVIQGNIVPNCTTEQDLDVDCSPVRFP